MFEVPIMNPDTGSVTLAVMLLMQESVPQATAVVNPEELIVAIPMSLDAQVTVSVMS
jgi:hypothetical protein